MLVKKKTSLQKKLEKEENKRILAFNKARKLLAPVLVRLPKGTHNEIVRTFMYGNPDNRNNSYNFLFQNKGKKEENSTGKKSSGGNQKGPQREGVVVGDNKTAQKGGGGGGSGGTGAGTNYYIPFPTTHQKRSMNQHQSQPLNYPPVHHLYPYKPLFINTSPLNYGYLPYQVPPPPLMPPFPIYSAPWNFYTNWSPNLSAISGGHNYPSSIISHPPSLPQHQQQQHLFRHSIPRPSTNSSRVNRDRENNRERERDRENREIRERDNNLHQAQQQHQQQQYRHHLQQQQQQQQQHLHQSSKSSNSQKSPLNHISCIPALGICRAQSSPRQERINAYRKHQQPSPNSCCSNKEFCAPALGLCKHIEKESGIRGY